VSADWVELAPASRDGDVVTATIRVWTGDEARDAGTIRFGSWEHLVVVYALDADDEVAERGAVSVLAARFTSARPPRDLYHLGVRRLSTARAWADAGLASGLMITGVVEGHNHYHDRWEALALPASAEVGPAGLVVGWAAEVAALPRLVAAGWPGVQEMLAAPTSSARIGAMRALSQASDLDPALRERAMLLALLDGSFEVRRLVGLLLIGFLPDVRWRVPPSTLIRHLERPLQSLMGSRWRPFVPDGSFSVARGTRNKRIASLFVLGGMFHLASDAPENVAWRSVARRAVGRRLRAQAAAWTPSEDARLARATRAELDGGALALAEPAMTLFATLRYALLRRELLARAAGRQDDRFYWLAELVDALVPPDARSAAARLLHAGLPRGVTRLRTLPAAWSGKVPPPGGWTGEAPTLSIGA
jgi:hypothetical protein